MQVSAWRQVLVALMQKQQLTEPSKLARDSNETAFRVISPFRSTNLFPCPREHFACILILTERSRRL